MKTPGNALPSAMVNGLRFPMPTAADFTPMKFPPAESKARFAVHFLRFASADFPKHHFTQQFYRQVMNTFGFIAHYDLLGFWSEYLTSTAGKVEFIDQVIHWPCHGDPAHTFCDAEREIARRLRQVDLLGFYRRIGAREREASDRAEFLRLKAKFEPSDGAAPGAPTFSATPPSIARRLNCSTDATQLALAIG
jgi:hypothetical protein